MKTIKFFAALTLCVLLSISTTYANFLPVDDVIIADATESVSVNWVNLRKQTVNVKIVNEEQEVVMNETVKNQTDFMKNYPVTVLPSGRYSMVITKANSRITQPFTVQNGELSLTETDKEVKYLPMITYKKDYFDVNCVLGYFGTITVNVLDENRAKLYSDKNKNVQKLHRRYSLKDLERGSYTVEVIMGGEVFYHSVVK